MKKLQKLGFWPAAILIALVILVLVAVTFRYQGRFAQMAPDNLLGSNGLLGSQASTTAVVLHLADRSKITLDNLAEFDLAEMVGTASTSFKGSSADRIKNITIGASKVNGIIVAPGEEFSLVEAIGYVNEEEGYTQEFVIREGQSIKEFGGGLCQLATTMFRAALDAGLPITERKNHSYVVGYYGPGLDATIYGPHPDLKFVNDTQNYLVIAGRVEDDRLVFEIHGQKDGRLATISAPEITNEINPPVAKFIPTFELAPGSTHCVERGRKGLTARVNYTVTYPTGEVKEKVFNSVYVPWQEVCYLGMAS